MSERTESPKVNFEAWSRSMIGFIRARGLEQEFKDWCGGWPCPVHTVNGDIDRLRTALLGLMHRQSLIDGCDCLDCTALLNARAALGVQS